MDPNTLAALRSVLHHERDDEIVVLRRELAAAHAANARLRAMLKVEIAQAELFEIMQKVDKQKGSGYLGQKRKWISHERDESYNEDDLRDDANKLHYLRDKG